MNWYLLMAYIIVSIFYYACALCDERNGNYFWLGFQFITVIIGVVWMLAITFARRGS